MYTGNQTHFKIDRVKNYVYMILTELLLEQIGEFFKIIPQTN
jgi:hypothetical protein